MSSENETSSALAERPDEGLAPAAPVHPAVNVYSLREPHWMAKALSAAVTLPDALRGKPEDILAVMLAGRELGIGPMQATRQIDIIQGQTALRSELKLALAKRAGHDIRPIVREPGRVRVKCCSCDSHEIEWALNREGAGAGATIATEIMVEKWTGERGARTKVMAPLVEKAAWQSWEGPMLWARAVGQLCREHCPEAVGGLYSTEELA